MGEAVRRRARRVAFTFVRIAWRLGVTPSELLDMRVLDALALLRGGLT